MSNFDVPGLFGLTFNLTITPMNLGVTARKAST